MSNKYILAIDQSTSGTKALIFNGDGDLIGRSDLPHEQIISPEGWVEHSPEEIYHNTLEVVKNVVDQTGIDKNDIIGVGISNQRETAMVWDRVTQKPVFNAIVWQCARGEAICSEISSLGYSEMVKSHTGLHLSPYFSAAKISWILKNVERLEEKILKNNLCCGTMDSWLVYKLTQGKSFKTDYSNASRTQLFNLATLRWDEEICELFGVNVNMLAEVCDSNAYYGETDFEGFLEHAIPIQGVLGDSHSALFAQGCIERGMTKTTYGTGSSIMMNIGKAPIPSLYGLVTSIAWGMDGKVSYVLEGNINYTGAVIKWLMEDMRLIKSPEESGILAREANQEDRTYLVPAFTGLGAPYWDSKVTATITGMTRTTSRAEVVKAGVECIAYQIADVVDMMSKESGAKIGELRVDGGPTRNKYLMQFQSDLLDIPVQVAGVEELSGAGAAYTAGIALGIYDKAKIFTRINRTRWNPVMTKEGRDRRYRGWKDTIKLVLGK